MIAVINFNELLLVHNIIGNEQNEFYKLFKNQSRKKCVWFLVLSYVYSKHPIFGLTQEWLRELSFSRLECGVHDKLHISSADWWDILLPLA